MLMAAMLPLAMQAQSTLTVHDGTTTNSNVPMYVSYFDDFTRAHVVYPASELSDMNGAEISSITFYCNSNNMPYTTVSTVDIYMTEVAEEGVSAFIDKNTATMVYQGTVSFEQTADGGEATITFDSPYTYNGGNLLFGCDNTTDAGYKFVYFLGETVNGASYSGYNASSLANVTSGTQRNFLPKTTFTYIPGGPVTCPRPTDLAYSNLTATSVDLSWTAGGSEPEWTLSVNGTEMTGITANPYTLTVTPETSYAVKVQANCAADDPSYWSNTVSFTTPASCIAPSSLAVVEGSITPTSAQIGWTANNGETEWTIDVNGTEITGVTENPYTLTNLTSGTSYTVKVKANCSADDASAWSATTTFFTLYGIPFVEQFPNSSIPVNWTRYSGLLEGVMGGTETLNTTSSGWYFGTSNGVFDTHTRLNIYGSSVKYWLVTPSLMMEDNVRLTFDLALTTYSGTLTPVDQTQQADDKFVVLVTTDNGTTWEILRQYDNAGSEFIYNNIATEGEFVSFDLSSYAGQNIAVAFYGESTASGGDNNLHIDNVRMDYIPACEAPTALQVSDVTATTAVLSWTENNATAATAWTIEVSGEEITVDENPYTLDNLVPDSAYVVKVRANCTTSDFSAWSNTANFTTLPTCVAPANVAAGSITTTTAEISWTDNNVEAPANGWTIEVNGTEVAAATNPFTLDNLTAATSYTVKVKANCADDDESAWSAEVTFSTECDAIVVTDATPYNQGFESAENCWTDEDNHWTYGVNYHYNAFDGDAYVYFSGSSFTVYTGKLISPILDLTGVTNPYLSFAHAQQVWGSDQNILRVFYRAAASDEWTMLVDYTTNIATWQEEEIALPNPSATYQIAFEGEAHYGYPVAVDAVSIYNNESAVEPCATPTNVAVNDNVVTWTGDAANYNVQVTVAGEVVIDTTVSTTTFTVEGLENNTHASVAVQAVCAEDDLSEWSEAVEFDYTNGINNYSLKANIYPNPTTGNVTVESDAINADITVFDAFGKLMMTSKVATERTELNFSEFAPGVYMVRIANDTAISTIKVVKK